MSTVKRIAAMNNDTEINEKTVRCIPGDYKLNLKQYISQLISEQEQQNSESTEIDNEKIKNEIDNIRDKLNKEIGQIIERRRTNQFGSFKYYLKPGPLINPNGQRSFVGTRQFSKKRKQRRSKKTKKRTKRRSKKRRSKLESILFS